MNYEVVGVMNTLAYNTLEKVLLQKWYIMATWHEKDIQQKKLLWSIDQNHMPYTNYHLDENIMPIEINWTDNYKYSMVSLSWHTNLQLKHKVMVVRG